RCPTTCDATTSHPPPTAAGRAASTRACPGWAWARRARGGRGKISARRGGGRLRLEPARGGPGHDGRGVPGEQFRHGGAVGQSDAACPDRECAARAFSSRGGG